MTLTCCARLMFSKYNSCHLRDGCVDPYLCLQTKDCSIRYKGVFERCTSTGSGPFELFGRDFKKILRQIVFIRVTTLSNTNLVALGLIKREKRSLRRLPCVAEKRRQKLPFVTCRTLIMLCDTWNLEIK